MSAKQKNKAQIQRKRVRAQQNVITSLCLACMVFCVGWSVYAATSEGSAKVQPAGDLSSSMKEIDINESSVIDTSSAEESSEEDMSVSEKESDSSSSENNDDTSKEESNDSSESKKPEKYKKVDLSDAVFIGDSRTVGLRNSSDKPKATFYCAVGLHIDTVLTAKDVSLENGKTGSVVDALKKKQFGRVYLNFGTNELGWPYVTVFKDKYSEVIKKIKELQPDAEIYVESILPVTASRDAKGDAINNGNVKTFNEVIKQAAAENGVNYLDCTSAVADANGYLPEEASTDGVHFTADYCLKWQNYIIENTY